MVLTHTLGLLVLVEFDGKLKQTENKWDMNGRIN